MLHNRWRSLVCQQHHWKSEAKEEHQLSPGGPNNRCRFASVVRVTALRPRYTDAHAGTVSHLYPNHTFPKRLTSAQSLSVHKDLTCDLPYSRLDALETVLNEPARFRCVPRKDCVLTTQQVLSCGKCSRIFTVKNQTLSNYFLFFI